MAPSHSYWQETSVPCLVDCIILIPFKKRGENRGWLFPKKHSRVQYATKVYFFPKNIPEHSILLKYIFKNIYIIILQNNFLTNLNSSYQEKWSQRKTQKANSPKMLTFLHVVICLPFQISFAISIF